MKLKLSLFMLLLFASIFISTNYDQIDHVNAYGGFTHRAISDYSIELMPDQWQTFLNSFMIDLSDASTEADNRKSRDVNESPKHFDHVDIPHLNVNVSSLSQDYSLGVVPWAIENSTQDLTIALQNRNINNILRYMGDVAHYVADATSPFHATNNSNGELTDNHGIHIRFEVDLVEIYADEIYVFDNFNPTTYVDSPYEIGVALINSSLNSLSTVLEADDVSMSQSGGNDNDIYYAKMFEIIGDLVRERIKLSIETVRNIWYSSFLDAGVISNDQTLGLLEMKNNTLISSNSKSVSYYFESKNIGDKMVFFVNDELFFSTQQNGRFPLDITNLIEGANSVKVRILDVNSNIKYEKFYVINIDTTPPTFTADFTINSIGSGDYEVILHVYSEDELTVIKGSVDGSVFKGWNNNTARIFIKGNYKIDIKIEDFAGWKQIESFDVKVGSSDDNASFYLGSIFVLILIPLTRRKRI